MSTDKVQFEIIENQMAEFLRRKTDVQLATARSRTPLPPEPSELQPNELLQLLARFFESNDIVYRVVGSMASIAYGENRFTMISTLWQT